MFFNVALTITQACRLVFTRWGLLSGTRNSGVQRHKEGAKALPRTHFLTLAKSHHKERWGGGATYHVTMQFGGTVLYVDEVSPVVDFYRRVFGLEVRFFDETLGFAELETGGSTLAIAAHSLGEMLMPNRYVRPADGRPAGIEIAFLTRDVPASFAKAIAEGATPITAPRRMPWGLEVAYVRAPEGTLIGFSEPPAATK
jgi:lactoylglutathione lyase